MGMKQTLVGAAIAAAAAGGAWHFLPKFFHDTQAQIDAMEIDLLKARIKAAEDLEKQLSANPGVIRDADVQVFVSEDVLNRALALLDGTQIPIPEHPDVKATLHSVRADFSDGAGAVRLKLEVARGELVLAVEGVALLVPDLKPTFLIENYSEPVYLDVPDKVEFDGIIPVIRFKKVKVLDIPKARLITQDPLGLKLLVSRLEPSVSWGPFSADIGGFVAAFAQLKLQEAITKSVPRLIIPVEPFVGLKRPAEAQVVAAEKFEATVSVPAVEWANAVDLKELLFLEDGIHIAGSLVEPTKAAQIIMGEAK